MWLEIIFLALSFFFLWQNLRKPSNYPPGPWGLPLIGHLPLGKESFEDRMGKLYNQHGKVASWRMGTRLVVLLFDYKLIKEAFGGFDMIDRPDIKFLSPLSQKPTLGVVGSNGIHWHTIRRFSLRHLRDLGMGKSRLVSAVQFEAMELVDDLKKRAGKPTTFPKSIIVSVLNVVWQLIASKRYGMDDNRTWVFHDLMRDFMMNVARLCIGDFFPWVKIILPKPLLNKLIRENIHEALSANMTNFLQKHVTEHMENLNPDDPRDFIDNYLLEMEKQKDDPNSVMSIDDLTFCIADLFGAGTETTTTTLQWIMLYLAKFPETQVKLQNELDEVLSQGTQATLEDKQRLPYTDAFIHEVLRFSSLASAGAFHKASKDTMIEGYLVPKDAFVLGVSGFSHYDPKYFDCPTEFRPERFLNSQGKFVKPKDGFFPFGTGRRQCLGEALARMEIFLFLTTMVQNVHFNPVPGKEIDLSPEPSSPFLRMPKKGQEILISVR